MADQPYPYDEFADPNGYGSGSGSGTGVTGGTNPYTTYTDQPALVTGTTDPASYGGDPTYDPNGFWPSEGYLQGTGYGEAGPSNPDMIAGADYVQYFDQDEGGSSGGGSISGRRGGSKKEEPKTCTVCGKVFGQTWEYNKHLKQHDKPLACDFCTSRFAHQRDLDRHCVANHREEAKGKGLSVERHNCKVKGCKETFSRKDHLRRHMKNKHGIDN